MIKALQPIFFIITFLLVANAYGQKTVQLKQEVIIFRPLYFHVDEVIDERKNTERIGSINAGDKTEAIVMDKMLSSSLRDFIKRNVHQSNQNQPIDIHIVKVNFNITKKGNVWIEDAEIVFAFYAGERKLIEYSGKSQKQTEEDPMVFVQEFMVKALENDLKRFDTWWQQNKEKVPVSSEVKVILTIGKTINKPNSIVYNKERLLTISDFEGTPEPNQVEMAATLSGVGMESSGETRNGQIVLNVVLTPYFSKSGSWYKKGGSNPKVLEHERTHFSITALSACETARQIRATTFSQTDYETKLKEILKKGSEAANMEQAKFDEESNHGTILDIEEQWEKKIRDEINRSECY